MKLGRVVRVCTAFLKGWFLISDSRMAKAMGSQEVRMPRPLMTKVLHSTSQICLRLEALENMEMNHSKPTNSQSVSLKGGR